jgi:hypothetical protein
MLLLLLHHSPIGGISLQLLRQFHSDFRRFLAITGKSGDIFTSHHLMADAVTS